MSEFTSIGDLTDIIIRDVAKNRAEHLNKKADTYRKRMLMSKDMIFVRRFVEASAMAEEAIVEVVRERG